MQLHGGMCRILSGIVCKVFAIFPVLEATRPRSKSGIQALCSLHVALEKSKSLLQHCSDCSKLYLVKPHLLCTHISVEHWLADIEHEQQFIISVLLSFKIHLPSWSFFDFTVGSLSITRLKISVFIIDNNQYWWATIIYILCPPFGWKMVVWFLGQAIDALCVNISVLGYSVKAF